MSMTVGDGSLFFSPQIVKKEEFKLSLFNLYSLLTVRLLVDFFLEKGLLHQQLSTRSR